MILTELEMLNLLSLRIRKLNIEKMWLEICVNMKDDVEDFSYLDSDC